MKEPASTPPAPHPLPNPRTGCHPASGSDWAAVRASSAVPAVFLPVRVGDREYVDGGLVSPVPVSFARQMGAELVIAVDISTLPQANSAGDTFKVLLQTFAIIGKTINTHELKNADLLVRPSLAGTSGTDFSSRKRSIEAGRAAMLAMLPRLRVLLTPSSAFIGLNLPPRAGCQGNRLRRGIEGDPTGADGRQPDKKRANLATGPEGIPEPSYWKGSEETT